MLQSFYCLIGECGVGFLLGLGLGFRFRSWFGLMSPLEIAVRVRYLTGRDDFNIFGCFGGGLHEFGLLRRNRLQLLRLALWDLELGDELGSVPRLEFVLLFLLIRRLWEVGGHREGGFLLGLHRVILAVLLDIDRHIVHCERGFRPIDDLVTVIILHFFKKFVEEVGCGLLVNRRFLLV